MAKRIPPPVSGRTRLVGWYIHREDLLSIRLLRSRKAWVMLATGGTATVTRFHNRRLSGEEGEAHESQKIDRVCISAHLGHCMRLPRFQCAAWGGRAEK